MLFYKLILFHVGKGLSRWDDTLIFYGSEYKFTEVIYLEQFKYLLILKWLNKL